MQQVLLPQLLVQQQQQQVIIRLLWVMTVRQLEPVLLLPGMVLKLVLRIVYLLVLMPVRERAIILVLLRLVILRQSIAMEIIMLRWVLKQ